jgi:ribonuclease Z
MTIQHQVLGQPGRDNALFIQIDTGQSIHRLLFDCGEGCLRDLAVAQIQAIDGLFFSHFHIDPVAGFDSFLRSNYNRPDRPVRLWGPAGAAEILQHRLCGVTWNLVAEEPGEFVVTEIKAARTVSYGFLTREGFAVAHDRGEQPFDGMVLDNAEYCIEARLMDHGTPSVAYCVREQPRLNIDTSRLAQLGLQPGPWLKRVKDLGADPHEEVEVGARIWRLGQLREHLLVTTPGESIAYLTDFRLDGPSEDRLVEWLHGCDTIVCENNFRDQDRELAERTMHMVSADVARLAGRVGPKRLILFHLSDRYTPAEWQEQLAEVRATFPETSFPDSWPIGGTMVRSGGGT